MKITLEQTNGFDYAIDNPPRTFRHTECEWWVLRLIDSKGKVIKKREGHSKEFVLKNFKHELTVFRGSAPQNKKRSYTNQIKLVDAELGG